MVGSEGTLGHHHRRPPSSCLPWPQIQRPAAGALCRSRRRLPRRRRPLPRRQPAQRTWSSWSAPPSRSPWTSPATASCPSPPITQRPTCSSKSTPSGKRRPHAATRTRRPTSLGAVSMPGRTPHGHGRLRERTSCGTSAARWAKPSRPTPPTRRKTPWCRGATLPELLAAVKRHRAPRVRL